MTEHCGTESMIFLDAKEWVRPEAPARLFKYAEIQAVVERVKCYADMTDNLDFIAHSRTAVVRSQP